jgi:hypothetical protein
MRQTCAAPFSEDAQLGTAASAVNGKAQLDIRLGDVGQSLVGPLDKAHTIAREVFIKPCIQEFVRLIEAIKIKVIQRYSRNCIRF